MPGWLRNWLRAWRTERLTLESPLPLPVVRERLIEGRMSYLRASFTPGAGGYRVVGRVGERWVSLVAARAGVRNSWRPVVRGRLEPTASGTRLVGSVGWSPFVRIFSGVWLGGVCAAFLGLTGHTVGAVWHGRVNGLAFLVCLVPLGFVGFFMAVSGVAVHFGRRDETYLRSWLADRLRTAEMRTAGTPPVKAPARPAAVRPVGPIRPPTP